MSGFGNPVPGTVHPNGWWTPGQLEFEVTDGGSFAEHVASNRGLGVDLGNGRCDGAVLAMAPGEVVYRQDAQGIIRIWHPTITIDGMTGWLTHYAHMFPILVNVGDQVQEGQQIGEVGNAGATACHLHTSVNPGGTDNMDAQQDLIPLLRQNRPPDPIGGDMLQGTNPRQLNNKVVSVLGDGTRLRAAPATGATPILATYGSGTVFTPDWEVTGQDVGGSPIWYGGWGQTPNGLEFGYFHSSVVSAPEPFEQSGHTDAELAAAIQNAAKLAAHGAAGDVAGAAVEAVSTTAAKYP